MNPSDDHEPGRNAALVVSLVLAIAFTAAFWDRLSVPFSTVEASFVHQALRASGQATSPDFDRPDNPVPAQVLAVVQQLVGFNERSLRLAILVLAIAAMAFLSEMVPGRGRVRFALPVLVLLSGIASQMGVLHPGAIVILPAALALLAAPLGPPVTNLRALLGLAGSLALGAIGFEAAIVSGAILVVVSLVRGTLLERLTGLVTAAAGVAMAWVIHGTPSYSFRFPALRTLHWSPDWIAIWPSLVYGALVLVSLFVNDGFRRHRAALATACVVGLGIAGGFLGGAMQWRAGEPGQDLSGLYLAVMTTTPAFYLLMAAAIAAFPTIVRVGLAVVLLGVIVIGFMGPPPPFEGRPLEVLAQARMVAQPGAALAVFGEDRVSVAVYARFGRAPMMPIAYVPEGVTLDDLAKWCRDRGIRQLWVSPPLDAAPPGFSAPASRPASVPLLMPLVVEGS